MRWNRRYYVLHWRHHPLWRTLSTSGFLTSRLFLQHLYRFDRWSTWAAEWDRDECWQSLTWRCRTLATTTNDLVVSSRCWEWCCTVVGRGSSSVWHCWHIAGVLTLWCIQYYQSMYIHTDTEISTLTRCLVAIHYQLYSNSYTISALLSVVSVRLHECKHRQQCVQKYHHK